MNFKTTLVLAVLVAAGAAWFWKGEEISQRLGLSAPPAPTASGETRAVLERELTPGNLRRIQIDVPGRQTVLERDAAGHWTLPGKWEARTKEVAQLVDLLTNLRSRFAPEPLGDGDLVKKGLAKPAAGVTVQAGDKSHTLRFGEEQGESNRFSRPTFLRVDELNEVVRLAPGLIGELDRPADYYHQRHLFPGERPKPGDADKNEILAATRLGVQIPEGNYTLAKTGDDWAVEQPFRDRVDPDKLKTLLTAVPDMWAEYFVDKPKPDLAEYGLKQPEQTLTVTRSNGQTVTLLIGKESPRKEQRKVTRQIPGAPGQPHPPMTETLTDRFRYAKLQDNDQIFEIKAEGLKDVFVKADTLRDAQLARFKTEDARKLQINYGGKEIVAVKDKDHWKVQKPYEAEAEAAKVTELLDKLSFLQARDQDVIDKADPKVYQLAPPAGTVKVDVEETKGQGETKTTTPKSFTFLLGKEDKEKNKLYVAVQGWPRVSAVEAGLLPLVQRPALAYRSRKVLDFSSFDLARIDVERGGEKFSLHNDKDVWKLASPVQTEADAGKAGQLAGDLGRVEAVEFVTDSPKPEELDKVYGLAKPALKATVTFSQKDKPAQTLLVGKPRGDKGEYFAKLASSPAVFVVKKEVRDALDQGSLAYRPLQLWDLKPEDVAEVRLQKDGRDQVLKKEADGWKVAEPFQAVATGVEGLLADLSAPKAERCEEHVAKDLGKYQLDKPAARLVVVSAAKKEGGKVKEPAKEHVLLLGKPTAPGAATRYAKLGSSEAVFVVGDKVTAAANRSALDLLDKNVLALEPGKINKVQSGGLTLERQLMGWKASAPGVQFSAAADEVNGFLGIWANLRAEKLADYGTKTNFSQYGLDKPERTVAVTVTTDGQKPVEHTLALGKVVPDQPGAVYARLDNGPGVLVLAPNTTAELKKTYLDFVDKAMWNLGNEDIAQVLRRRGSEEFEAAKKDGSWQLLKPVARRADEPTLTGLLGQLKTLRAARVAAYPAKDVGVFGLENPDAVVTLKPADPKGRPHVLRLGKVADEKTGDCFAQVEGSDTVAVLPGELARRLTAPPLHFQDRNLARFGEADQVVLERGSRKATFRKVDGTWKLTDPVESEAENYELEEFVNRSLSKLRADELVAEKPGDLKPYGLEHPEARWLVKQGDKDLLTLLVGSPEKSKTPDTARRYAQLAGGDVVFLLDKDLTAKATAEYRSRTVFASLDAAQAETVRFAYAENPFVLEKADNTWKVVANPAAKVKSEAVSDALDALSRLKAERYVVDRTSDLKIYGLEPPQLVLEVQVPSGKRTLHVGRQVGGSGGYYARVPEANRSDVFIVAEADAQKILRPLRAFTGEDRKTTELPSANGKAVP